MSFHNYSHFAVYFTPGSVCLLLSLYQREVSQNFSIVEDESEEIQTIQEDVYLLR